MPEKISANESGFKAMGKPISATRRQAAYDTCKEFGLDTEAAWDTVSRIANALERDEPYNAIEVGMTHVDITGVYRIMAVLLTA